MDLGSLTYASDDLSETGTDESTQSLTQKKKNIFILSQPRFEPTVAASTGSPTQRADHRATTPGH